MTIEEINALTVEDVERDLLSRLGIEENPNDGTLEAELEVYKAELIAIEQERLRKLEWYANLGGLVDLRLSMNELGLDIPNAALYVKSIVEYNDEQAYQNLLNQDPITKANLEGLKQSEDAKKLARQNALQAIENIQWSQVTTVANLKAVVKNLIDLVK